MELIFFFSKYFLITLISIGLLSSSLKSFDDFSFKSFNLFKRDSFSSGVEGDGELGLLIGFVPDFFLPIFFKMSKKCLAKISIFSSISNSVPLILSLAADNSFAIVS